MNNLAIKTLINGQESGFIDITDRGLQFGDGVFETLRVHEGKPIWWQQHIDRLLDGCRRLQFSIIPDVEILRLEADKLLADCPSGTLKIIITRGNSTSGYAAPADTMPNRVLIMTSGIRHQTKSEQGVILGICKQRITGCQQLSGIKHLNRLEQVLARMECQAEGWDEGLMLDNDDRVIEGSMSNLFVCQQGRLLTPRLEQNGIEGICRGRIILLAEKNGINVEQCDLGLHDLLNSDELFLSNSLIGIWPVARFDDKQYQPGPNTRLLQDKLEEELCSAD